MTPQDHPRYWRTHKNIWQEEYNNLDGKTKAMIDYDSVSDTAREFNNRITQLTIRKLYLFYRPKKNKKKLD